MFPYDERCRWFSNRTRSLLRISLQGFLFAFITRWSERTVGWQILADHIGGTFWQDIEPSGRGWFATAAFKVPCSSLGANESISPALATSSRLACTIKFGRVRVGR